MKELVLNIALTTEVLPNGPTETISNAYNGMSLIERLKKSSLLGYYETAVHIQDKDWLRQILRLVEIDDAAIELILCKTGVY